MLEHDHYTYRVTWSEEDQEHVGLCAEFPSLSWLDSTPEGALKGIRQVVADVAADMAQNGEKIPAPLAAVTPGTESSKASAQSACAARRWRPVR